MAQRLHQAMVGLFGLALVLAAPRPSAAVVVSLDFESLSDQEPVTNQFGGDGIFFSNTTALVSGAQGGSLNEIDFPPHSGFNVVTHDFDDREQSDALPMIIDFATPFDSVSGFFTYADFAEEDNLLTLSAFDSSNAFLGSVTSSSSDNQGSHEQLVLSGFGPISRVEFAGGPQGTFTLDDLELRREDVPAAGPVVPEPSSLLLLGSGLMGLGLFSRRQR